MVKCGHKNSGNGKGCKGNVFKDGLCYVHHNILVNKVKSLSDELIDTSIEVDASNIDIPDITGITIPDTTGIITPEKEVAGGGVRDIIGTSNYNNIDTIIDTNSDTIMIDPRFLNNVQTYHINPINHINSHENVNMTDNVMYRDTTVNDKLNILECKVNEIINQLTNLNIAKKPKTISTRQIENIAKIEHYNYYKNDAETVNLIDNYYKSIGILKYNKHFIRAYINDMFTKLEEVEKGRWMHIALAKIHSKNAIS